MHYACFNGLTKCVRLLLRGGKKGRANLKLKDVFGQEPRDDAQSRGQTDVLKVGRVALPL